MEESIKALIELRVKSLASYIISSRLSERDIADAHRDR